MQFKQAKGAERTGHFRFHAFTAFPWDPVLCLTSWRSTGELLARETSIFPIRAIGGAFKLPFGALPRWCAAVSVSDATQGRLGR